MNRSVEILNVQKLKIITNNFETLKDSNWDEQDAKGQLEKLKKLVKSCKKQNTIKTEYMFGKNKQKGRKYVKGVGLQSLPRLFRNTLADEYYDYDIVNCFPTLLQNYCLEQKYPSNELILYNKNRSRYIQESSFDVKKIMNCIMNNGFHEYNNLKDKPEWLIKLKNEISAIHSLIRENPETAERYKKIKKPNAMGTLMFEILENIESKILDDMIDYVKEQLGVDTTNIILMYDGFMLPKSCMTDEQLEQLNNYVDAKYKVQIIKKPMETLDLDGLEIEKELPQNDYDSAVAFMDWLDENGYRLIRHDKDTYFYDKDKGIYTKNIYELRRLIALCDMLNDGYRKFTSKQNALLTQVETLIPNDDEFLINKQQSTYRKLPFKNGVYDFETKELLDFSADYIFDWKLKWDYNPNFDMSNQDEVYTKLIENIFGKEIGDYFLKIVGRAIAGEIYDKKLFMVIGDSNSGKGVITDLIKSAFGNFADCFNANALCSKKFSSTDYSKELSWIVQLISKRIIFSNEMNMEHTLNGNLIKTISAGGDGITARQNYKDEQIFQPQFTPFMFAQDCPKIEPYDDAVRNRIRYLRTQYSYLSGSKYEKLKEMSHVRQADPKIKNIFIKKPEIIQTFMYMVINAYDLCEPIEPETVIAETDEWEDSEDCTQQILELVTTGNDNDYITVKQFNSKVNGMNLKISNRKVKDIMIKNGHRYGQKWIEGKNTKVYLGIKWANDSSYDF
jgi:phage/plasmid-associated DNA primase